MNKDFSSQRASLYAVMIPGLRELAKSMGYCLAIHGSLQRDLDLVAVPWIEEVADPLELALAIKEHTGGFFHHPNHDYLSTDGFMSIKPHQRMCWSIHLTDKGSDGPYIDLSVTRATKDHE